MLCSRREYRVGVSTEVRIARLSESRRTPDNRAHVRSLPPELPQECVRPVVLTVRPTAVVEPPFTQAVALAHLVPIARGGASLLRSARYPIIQCQRTAPSFEWERHRLATLPAGLVKIEQRDAEIMHHLHDGYAVNPDQWLTRLYPILI